MKKLLYLSILCFLTALPGYSQGLLYFSEHETDSDDNPVWFTPGSYQGNVHSNGVFHFREPQQFGEMLSSSADTFEISDDIEIDEIERPYGQIFNLREVHLEDSDEWIRENADRTFDSHDGRFFTRVKLLEDQGIEIHQYPAGQNYRDSIIWRSPPIAFGALFVDGEVEIEGVLIGKLSIVSSGDMYLVDNIRYSGANDMTGRFGDEPEDMFGMPHMLSLVSEKSIIIADNDVNGKANGWDEGPNRPYRHSIIIDASLYALGGSFTLEHKNNENDEYQGPEPDERGIIYLTGCVYQKYASEMHNDNHGGTGYRIDYQYDYRLDISRDPHQPLFETSWYFVPDNFATIRLNGNQAIIYKDREIARLIAGPGSEITFAGTANLTILYEMVLNGSADEPVRVTYEGSEQPGRIVTRWWDETSFYLKNTIFVDQVELSISSDTIAIVDSCVFNAYAGFYGTALTINNCSFLVGGGIGSESTTDFKNSVIYGSFDTSGPVIMQNCELSGDRFFAFVGEGSFSATNSHFEYEQVYLLCKGIEIDSCEFKGDESCRITVEFSGRYEFPSIDHEIANSQLDAPIDLIQTGNLQGIINISNNLIRQGIVITHYTDNASDLIVELTNNTIVDALNWGITLDGGINAVIRNNIIGSNAGGINCLTDGEVALDYNDVYLNYRDGRIFNYVNCDVGDSSISANPLFIDSPRGNYNLGRYSPCIDAGDPDSPLDPDGSRADMGAFPYNHNVAVENQSEPVIPASFEFLAYPNPFNSRTTLNYSLPEQAHVSVSVFDLSGRQIAVLADGADSAGLYSVAWDGMTVPSGIYMVVVKAGKFTETRKLVLMR